MIVQITNDEQGISVWPGDTELQYDGSEWFDANCDKRGTNGMQDWDSVRRLIGCGLLMPDYLNDLNAMHEALLTINKETGEWVRYLDVLGELLKPVYVRNHVGGLNDWWWLFHSATAAQRAEAFVLTMEPE
jgi:hypothetical protein